MIRVSGDGTVSFVEMQQYTDTNLDFNDDVTHWLTSVLQLGVGVPIYDVLKKLHFLHERFNCHFYGQFLWHTARRFVFACCF